MIKIAVDAMGGDFAPEEIVRGSVLGAKEHGVGIILVGPQERIQPELTRHNTSGLDIEIVHTDEYLVEGEPPAYALRKKRNASIMVATRLVKEGRAAAVVGVGPTGGVFASALQVLGLLEGLSRPVIGGPFLGFAPQTMMIDLGVNADCRPDQLLDFGIIGMVYARKYMNISNPTVALLSNGREEGKGNAVVKEAYRLFKMSGLNFIGNVEGNDIVYGRANVIICDGFMGNVVIKFCEGLGTAVAQWIKEKLEGRLPEGEIAEVVTALKQATNSADTAGGGPLWGVNGVVCKAHGRSKAPEVARAIATAKHMVETDLVGTLKSELAAIRSRINAPNTNA